MTTSSRHDTKASPIQIALATAETDFHRYMAEFLTGSEEMTKVCARACSGLLSLCVQCVTLILEQCS